jgi:predicted kinase
MHMRTKLVVMSGLPCSGKSTVAERLSAALSLPVISVDPVEAAMWISGIPKEMTGIAAYAVVSAIAREQLRLGLSVVVDAVNPVEIAREMWRVLAREQAAELLVIECVCSARQLHRQRVEARQRSIPGMPEVTWERVEERRAEYEPWQDERLVLDTAQDIEGVAAAALSYVSDA